MYPFIKGLYDVFHITEKSFQQSRLNQFLYVKLYVNLYVEFILNSNHETKK